MTRDGAIAENQTTGDTERISKRTQDAELFGNFGYMWGKFQSSNEVDMLTQSSVIWNQTLAQDGNMCTNE